MPDQEPTFAVINPNINQNLAARRDQTVNGRQMKALKIKYDSAFLEAQYEGPSVRATIINANPVALQMEGGVAYKVPSIMDPSIAPKELLHFEYGGKDYRATHLTIEISKLYSQITDVYRQQDDDMAEGVGVYDIKKHLPIEIAHSFWQLYNSEGNAACNMGGVIVFQGSLHDLRPKKGQEKEPIVLKIPAYRQLPDRRRSYYTKEATLSQLLAEQLDKQRAYCGGQVSQANLYHADPAQHGNITIPHRVWHQYQLDMGWAATAQPWLMMTVEATAFCGGCGAAKTMALAHLCKECGRPFDPLTAYLAGEIPITSVYMERIPDADWDRVRTEEKRRRDRRRLLLDDEPEAPVAGKGK